ELQNFQATTSVIARYNKRLENVLNNEITTLQSTLDGYSKALSEHSKMLASQSEIIASHDDSIRSHDDTLAAQNDTDKALSEALTAQSNAINANADKLKYYSADLEQNARAITSLSDTIKAHSDTLAAHSKTFSDIWSRVDFIRSELLYEFMYSDKKKAPKATVKVQILNKEKYEAMKGNYKINVGCGHVPVEGYLNIDKRKLPGVDIVADVYNMPFEKETVYELFSSHFIEHFPEEEFRRALLPSWYNLIKKGGILRAVFPDSITMMEQYLNGNFPFDRLRMVTFGAQDYDGDFHYNMFSKESLSNIFTEAGFVKIEFPVIGRWNSGCYEMEVVGYKQ
ncbi:MAG TPA: hypothetical protein VJL89_09640, partial [Thermodesulfovibrionia bacterium]|nr:hypothetical protein [Thermodesulfovibrionia bacterium]